MHTSPLYSYKTAAERIKILSIYIKVAPSTPSAQNRQCCALKPLKLSHPMRHVSYYELKQKKGDKDRKQIKASAVNSEQKIVSFLQFTKDTPLQKNPLQPERFKRWRFKEQQLAKRKLKGIHKEVDSKKRKITLMEDTSISQEEQSQNILWQDLLKLKEERQFNITRIAKYFSS